MSSRSPCVCTTSNALRSGPSGYSCSSTAACYRSDDAGRSWAEIGAPLPSDFGFPLAVDPADPDSAYVIPLVADLDRVTPEGRVRGV